MKYFLLVYSRAEGRLVRPIEVFSDCEREAALLRRFEVEREVNRDRDIEVVVLGSESEETIRKTHGRYFYSAVELLQRVTI